MYMMIMVIIFIYLYHRKIVCFIYVYSFFTYIYNLKIIQSFLSIAWYMRVRGHYIKKKSSAYSEI